MSYLHGTNTLSKDKLVFVEFFVIFRMHNDKQFLIVPVQPHKV